MEEGVSLAKSMSRANPDTGISEHFLNRKPGMEAAYTN
jgi:hypothetical protein